MSMKERLTSWVTWTSVLSLVGLILMYFGVFDKLGMDLGKWETLVEAILGVLVAFGILNNPTDKKNF